MCVWGYHADEMLMLVLEAIFLKVFPSLSLIRLKDPYLEALLTLAVRLPKHTLNHPYLCTEPTASNRQSDARSPP